jgi:CSLREA domain-containing protein
MPRENALSFLRIGVLPALLMLTLAGTTATFSAELFVNSTEDTQDSSCDPLPLDCTLREAVNLTNLSPGADIIHVPAGTFLLTSAGGGTLDIVDALEIEGQGPGSTFIDATDLGHRAFLISADLQAVRLASLTVTGGTAADVMTGEIFGGGIYHEAGNLVLDDVAVTGNLAIYGGGVAVQFANLTVERSTISDNWSISGGGLLVASADLAIVNSLVSGNSCDDSGAGIASFEGNLTVTDTTVAQNRASMQGGGILLVSTNCIIYGSTIAHNTALDPSEGGGGIYIESTPVSVDIGNSTIYGNSATSTGGAFYVAESGVVATAALTISANVSSSGFDVHNVGHMEMYNTIVEGTCAPSGAMVSWGGNLESPLNLCQLVHASDQTGVQEPLLSQLGEFGGRTATVLPLVGSPAIGGGDDVFCSAVDQRGLERADGSCDSGAVERQPVDFHPIFIDGFEWGDGSRWSFTSG